MNLLRNQELRLLTLGAGPRLAGAAIVVLIIWVGFYWAITPPGSL